MYFSKPLLNRFVIIEALTYTHGIYVDGVYTPKLSTYRIYFFLSSHIKNVLPTVRPSRCFQNKTSIRSYSPDERL